VYAIFFFLWSALYISGAEIYIFFWTGGAENVKYNFRLAPKLYQTSASTRNVQWEWSLSHVLAIKYKWGSGGGGPLLGELGDLLPK